MNYLAEMTNKVISIQNQDRKTVIKSIKYVNYSM